MNLEQREKLYHYGFLVGEFEQTPTLSRLIEICQEIRNRNIKKNYNLVEKYPNTLDLKPCPIDYDKCFLEVIKENNIDKIFEDCVGSNICLNNLQIRTAYSDPRGNEHNYMPWHRDNYIYQKEPTIPVGPMPPGYKLNFYPDLDDTEDKVLALIPGSHLQVKFNRSEDFSQEFSYAPVEIKTSKNQYIIFNTSVMHGTLPMRNRKGSLRILYNFVPQMHINIEESKEINKKYKDFLYG